MATEDEEFDIDYCRNCASFWFSNGKLDRLPTDRAGEIPNRMDPDQLARETGALVEVQEVRRRSAEDEPTEMWTHIIVMMGLPVEENHPSHKQPLATWSIAALCTVVIPITLTYPGSLVYNLGFIPNEPFRYGGINLLTSFFTHGCWAHLFGNIYSLCVFGDNVEERLGVRSYLLMLLAGSIAGTLAHSLFDSRSGVPLIGVSDSISAIIVYYALQFPRERLCFLL